MKGDNYVGAGEPQLREKMGDLYSTIAGYYGRPSQTQMDNLKLIETKMEEARKNFTAIKDKYYSKYKTAIEKAGLKGVELKTKEEFLKKE
jgi:hypothetical protein